MQFDGFMFTCLCLPKLLHQVIQACGGAVDPTLTSRCTHLLCESQVSNLYVQVRARAITTYTAVVSTTVNMPCDSVSFLYLDRNT